MTRANKRNQTKTQTVQPKGATMTEQEQTTQTEVELQTAVKVETPETPIVETNTTAETPVDEVVATPTETKVEPVKVETAPTDVVSKETKPVTLLSKGAPTGPLTIEGFLKSKYNLEPENYTDTLKRVIRGFQGYFAVMNARCPVDLVSAAKHQTAWLRVILDALEAPTAEAVMCFDVILFVAHQNRNDLFSDRLACRAFNLMSDSTRNLFLALQTLIINAADARKRKKYITEQVRLETITAQLRTDNQKTNLMAYFANNI